MKRILLFTILSLFGKASMACSCAHYDLEEAFIDYDYVFEGKVVSVGSRWFWDAYSDGPIEISFDVIKSYKNNIENSIEVYTISHTSACGFPFEDGGTYIVFASIADKNDEKWGFSKKGKPTTSLCSPTVKINSENEYESKEANKIIEFLKTKSST